MWDLAGLSDTETGVLGIGGLATSGVFPPASVELDGERIRFEQETPWWERQGSPTKGMLDAFVRIDSPEDVVRFARKWGVLSICEHNLPSSHSVFPWPAKWSPPETCTSLRDSIGAWEPVERWLHFSSRARSVLSLAAAIHLGERGEDALWEEAAEGTFLLSSPNGPAIWHKQIQTLQGARDAISDIVWEWLRLGGTQPAMKWDESGPHFVLWASTFGNLAIQLMQTVTRSNGIALCSACGLPYAREGRRVQTGWRNYCPACGRSAALRDAKNAQRERKRVERESQG